MSKVIRVTNNVTYKPNLTHEDRLRHPEKAFRPDHDPIPKPNWLRVKAPGNQSWNQTHALLNAYKITTVCQEAACPNIGECWQKKHATFLILGDICTRACAFCNVATGRPQALDKEEPERVAAATKALALTHVVITSVDRDDLVDGGAEHFAATIQAIRSQCPQTTIEILTPDFLKKAGAIEKLIEANPDVFNHNIETVPSLYPWYDLAHVTFTQFDCCNASKSSRLQWSQNLDLCLVLAKIGMKFCKLWMIYDVQM